MGLQHDVPVQNVTRHGSGVSITKANRPKAFSPHGDEKRRIRSLAVASPSASTRAFRASDDQPEYVHAGRIPILDDDSEGPYGVVH